MSILFSLFTAGLAYGSLHLLAWRPPVRTATERLLWRTREAPSLRTVQCLLFLSGVPISFDIPLGRLEHLHTRCWSGYVRGPTRGRNRFLGPTFSILDRSVEAVLSAIIIPGTLFYTLARVYLVVECFISVGRLPASVLETSHRAKYLLYFS